MAIASESDLRFAPGSTEFQDQLVDMVVERLTRLAIEKVKSENRSDITREDVKACVKEAMEQVVNDVLNDAVRAK